jgi:hypothetical protein
MAKHKRSREEAETYESDRGFVSNDDGNAPKSKKSKKAGVSKGSSSGDDQFWAVSISLCSPLGPIADLDNQLSSGRNPRRVNVSEFKNNKLINIREFYEKDDEYLPGKKVPSIYQHWGRDGMLMINV